MMLEGVQDGEEATSPGRWEGERGELGTGPWGCGGIVVSIWETKYNLQLEAQSRRQRDSEKGVLEGECGHPIGSEDPERSLF